jgi:RNA polymerase sigma-70 factor (ECF subfamily)
MESDEVLLREIARNKPVAIEAIYDRYAPALLSVSLRYCGNKEDAEDVLHNGFIKILKSLDKFRPRSDGSLEGWMKRIIVNTALNHLRDHSRQKRFMDIELLAERIAEQESADEEETGIAYLARSLGKEKIMQMICELPHGYRAVFNMYVCENFSHKEIAKQLGCSENTSKSQLSKARVWLRKKIDEEIHVKKMKHEKRATPG